MNKIQLIEFISILSCLILLSISPLITNAEDAFEYRIEWDTVDTDGPEVTEVSFVFDPQSNKALLFSGYDLAENDLQTTWVYDFIKNSWENMTASMANPEVQPGPRIGYNGAYDPLNDKIIIFGGFIDCHGNYPVGCDNWGDTWSYDIDANTWTDLKPENSPPPHSYGQLVYDIESKKMILFGGYGDGIISMGETWVYDPTTNDWTNMGPVISPPGRHAPIMIYDPQVDRIIMFGGVNPWNGAREDHLNDTWSYDVNTNTWIELFPNGSPSKRLADTFFYIPSIGKSILSGGWLGYGVLTFEGEPYNDTWLYDYSSNTWTEISSDFPIKGLWGASVFNNIDNNCYLYDFNEFKIRIGTAWKYAISFTTFTSTTTETKTETITETTTNIANNEDSDFYILSPLLLLPLFVRRYRKHRIS